MIRLLSFNLQHGRPGDGARLDPATAPLADSDIADAGAAREVLAALADQIRDIDPDVIALQEVDLGQARSGRLHQAAFLAGVEYSQAVPSASGVSDIVSTFDNELPGLAGGDPAGILNNAQVNLQAILS